MRKILSILLLISSLVLTAEAQTKRGRAGGKVTIKGTASVPKSVRKEIIEAKPDLSLGQTVEKYVSSYELNRDGTAKQTWEMQQRCENELCVARIANTKHVYNSDLQKISVVDAYVLKPGGKKISVPVAAIQNKPTAQAEAAPGFSSLREVEINFENLKPGDSAYLKLEILTTKSTFDRHFDSLENFPLIFDWKSIEINISAPADYPVFIDSTGLEGGKLTDESGRSRWQFRKQNVASLEIEPAMYDVVSISPRMALTTFKSFDELGSAFWENVKKKAIVTPEVQAIADEVTKGITDPKQQVSAIYDWANKNIRYLLIVLDRGGWIPHSSTEIIANRYGDCKDYTTIIYALLKAKGIESVPVLIRSELGDWFPEVATADYFNHAILYIPGIDMFADATTPNTRLGLVPQSLVGKKALLAGEKTGIIEVPRNNPDENQMISDVTMVFSSNGTVKARSRNTYVGRAEIIFRPMFGDSTLPRNSPLFVKSLLAYFGVDGTGSIVSVGNPHKVGEPFAMEMEAAIENFTTFLPKGRLSLPVGINMIHSSGLEAFTGSETRRTNLITGATRISEKLAVNLPPTVAATVLPKPVKFANAVGSYKIEFDLKDNQVKIARELIIAKDFISPGDYAAFKELVRKAAEGESVEIEYTADPSLLRAKSKELKSAPVRRSGSGSFDDMMMGGMYEEFYKKLKPAEVRRMEAKLVTDENDSESRMRLIRHYAGFNTKKTPATEKGHLQHRLWLVRNRPEVSDYEIYGWHTPQYDSASSEYLPLKTEWLARVEADKKNSKIRLNAVGFVKQNDPEVAEKLAVAGSEIEPDNYKFPLLLTELKAAQLEGFDQKISPEKRISTAEKLLNYGETALKMIKSERSEERDADRSVLLKRLCGAAIESGKLERAAALATELILDFGQSSTDFGYDEAAHVGNITLGRVEFAKNNIEKAGDHLLIAIRAPLRKDYNSIEKIDMRLAKELYEKGEKEIVLEYLRLCLNLGNLKEYPESHEDEIKALKLWQEQIGKGIKPSFDFKAP